MMRFQRLSSPDVLLLGNARRPGLKTSKEYNAENGGGFPNYSPLEAKSSRVKPGAGSDYPSPTCDRHFFSLSSSDSPPAVHSDNRTFTSPATASASPGPAKAQTHHRINGPTQVGGGDVLLRWGHKKRSRAPRTEGRASAAAAAAAAADGGDSSAHARSVLKLQRRSSAAAAAAAMPPPGGPHPREAKLRPATPGRDAITSIVNRGVDERSEGRARPDKRSPRRPPEKAQKTSANASPRGGANADVPVNPEPKQPPSDPEAGATKERLNLDHFEWPRIYVSLSRKEKEDDFLAMKGTKLSQRPKKRAKNIDRTLQYVFPGMWLSDLTRGRYEVREKKCAKKPKRRGLKGMESLESDSE